MNDGTDRVPRLIVGISRSPASWWALAWAVGEARRRGARVLLVHVFRPPMAPSLIDTSPFLNGTPRDPYPDYVAYGNTLMREAIRQAVGQMPGDVPMEHHAVPGRPAAELASFACGGDLVVLGCRHRGWLGRRAPGSVARACARRTDCLVVIVPEPSHIPLPVPMPTSTARGHGFRWMPHHRSRSAQVRS
jgi:nucleotide-binding universal stress UspA family protein